MKRSLDKFNALVESLQSLPTIGQKSATRLAYHMVMHDSFGAMKLAHAIENALGTLRKCTYCGGISEDELCDICSDEMRDKEVVCMVEDAKDILVLEEHHIFSGRYYVLGSLDTLDIAHLRNVLSDGVKELLFALTPSVASDAAILYIEDKLSDLPIRFSKIAQGVPTGVSLENVDMLSLSRALEGRVKI